MIPTSADHDQNTSVPGWTTRSHLPPPPDNWTTGPAAAPPDGGPGGLSVQHLLLGLGTALVAVATVVFTAVNWDRMGASVQALLLVAATAVAGAGAAACARRCLPATAEALGVVALLLAIADAHAFRVGLFAGAPRDGYWAGALAVVSLGAWAYGSATGLRSPRIAAAVLGQLPLLLALGALEVETGVAELLVLVQVAVVVLLVARLGAGVATARSAAGAMAATQAAVVVLAALVQSVLAEGPGRRGSAAVLALAAAVAALVAWLAAGDDEVRPLALTTSTALGLAASAAALWSVVPGGHGLAATGLAAALVVGLAVRLPARWGGPPAAVAAVAGGLAAVPLLGAMATALLAAAEVLPRAWDLDAGRQASSLLPAATRDLVGEAVGLHLLALAALVGAGAAVLARRTTVVLAGGVALLAVLVAPVVAPISVAAAAGLALGVAVALVVVAGREAGRPGVLAGASAAAVAPFAVALTWAAATPSLTLGVLAVGLGLSLVVVAAARSAGQEPVAVAGAVAAVLGAAVLAGLAATAQGVGPGASWAAAAAVAAGASLLGGLLVGVSPLDRALGRGLDAAWWTAHAVALWAVASMGNLGGGRAVLAVGVVAFGLAAREPHRRVLGGLAVGQAVVLLWLQLAEAHVVAPEPYALPLAGVLLAAGLFGERCRSHEGRTSSSWITLGPGLVVAAVPSVVASYAEAGLVRPLAALVLASVVLAAGALHGRRAPVDVGTAVVVAIGLRQLAPVVGELPNWATIGAAGALLLAVGATFEQRRRDVHQVHDRYRSLA